MNYGGRPFRGPGPYGGGPWGGPGPSRPPFQQRPFPPSPFQQPPHRQQYQQQYGPPHTQPPPTSYPQRLPPSHTASHSNPGPPMQAQHHMRPPRNSPTPASASSGDTEKVPFVGYEATVYIGMENAPAEFGLELRLSGEKGANLDYLSQATKAKVVLWGHGTGINERKPLHLYIVHDTLKGKEEAVSLANHLVRTVKDELCDWRKEQDLLKHRKTSHKRRSRSPRSRSPLSDAEPPDEKRSRRTMRGRSPVERDEKHHRSSDPKAGPAEAKQADNSQRNRPIIKTHDILLVSDSRGKHLQSLLSDAENLKFNIVVKEDFGVVDLARVALGAHPEKYDLVILSGGIVDIAHKNNVLKQLVVRTGSSEELVDVVMKDLTPLVEKLKASAKKVMLTPTYGANLQIYSEFTFNGPYRGDSASGDQAKVNDTIFLLNKRMTGLNAASRILTPYIANDIHKGHGKAGKMKHHYHRLVNGFYPGDWLAERMAKTLVRIILWEMERDASVVANVNGASVVAGVNGASVVAGVNGTSSVVDVNGTSAVVDVNVAIQPEK